MTARLEISTDVFLRNLDAVSARISPGEFMLVTKDDAYAHGLDWAVSAARSAGVHWFGSYDVASALRIRTLAPDVRIFAWATSTADEVAQAILADVDLGVGTPEYLRRVVAEAERLQRRARVHLKVDTGLHRNGIRPEQWPDAVAEARRAEEAGLLRVTGVWSHLAEASDAEDDAAQRVFLSAVDALRAAGGAPRRLHLTASAASWWRPELRGTLSRIGAFCYGIRSADGPELDGIRPAAALRADVIDVRDGRARIDVGALDGLPSNLVGASIDDGRARIVRVERTWTEISGIDDARTGRSITVFGPDGVSATDLAEHIDTVGEEILTRVSPLLERRYS
ncbi:alanine racemase [Microbacterium abyssi]|uniref:alanine racemase n=1 Tax=Microbacterium abyssi TaxID=2782166 RepID=UPI001886FA6E|nr:alanine racemase [Microbacterium sp. A18JL241]